MSQNVRKRIHLIYGIVFTAVTLIAGICLMAACYGIYTAGLQSGAEQIYSRAIVSQAFSVIAIPVYLCLALTIGGFLLHLALPVEQKKAVPEKNRQLILSRLQAKTDLAACETELRNAIAKQEKTRRLHISISAMLLAVSCLAFLIYACLPDRWPEDLTQVTSAVASAVKILFACLAIPAGYTIFTVYFCRNSLDKQIALMKQAATQAPISPSRASASNVRSGKRLLVIRCAVTAIAVALLMYGYFTGGIEDVVAKAAAICTECVGLG